MAKVELTVCLRNVVGTQCGIGAAHASPRAEACGPVNPAAAARRGPTRARVDGAARPGSPPEPGLFDPEDRLDRLMGFGRRHVSRFREERGARQVAAAT